MTDSLVPPTWEPTESEIEVSTRAAKCYQPSIYGTTVEAMVNAVGPLITARALREAADDAARIEDGVAGVRPLAIIQLLRARAAALEGRAT